MMSLTSPPVLAAAAITAVAAGAVLLAWAAARANDQETARHDLVIGPALRAIRLTSQEIRAMLPGRRSHAPRRIRR
jgi:hypothetical protein